MKFTKYALATVLSLGTLAGTGVAAFAAEEDGYIRNYKSNGLVEFFASEDPTSPVDPINPGGEDGEGGTVTPIDPTDPNGPNPGTAGPLSIDFASSLDFGQNKISSKNETYYANPQLLEEKDEDGNNLMRPNYVQVTDNRGTNTGWVLKVKQEDQFRNDNTLNSELTGAEINFTKATVASNMNTDKTPNVGDVTLIPGEAVEVMSANEGTGAGTWIDRFGSVEEVEVDGEMVQKNTAITLSVPGSTAKDAAEYRTVLTWTLTDAPGNGDDTETEINE